VIRPSVADYGARLKGRGFPTGTRAELIIERLFQEKSFSSRKSRVGSQSASIVALANNGGGTAAIHSSYGVHATMFPQILTKKPA
jgi:hypothetical protein